LIDKGQAKKIRHRWERTRFTRQRIFLLLQLTFAFLEKKIRNSDLGLARRWVLTGGSEPWVYMSGTKMDGLRRRMLKCRRGFTGLPAGPVRLPWVARGGQQMAVLGSGTCKNPLNQTHFRESALLFRAGVQFSRGIWRLRIRGGRPPPNPPNPRMAEIESPGTKSPLSRELRFSPFLCLLAVRPRRQTPPSDGLLKGAFRPP
jgi:hypothetical protein